jgi:hypothetical protein
MHNFNQKLAEKIGLSKSEIAIFKKLKNSILIQDFLQKMVGNLEKNGETLMSPRTSLRNGICHCAEGALIAALALWLYGNKPLLVDLKTKKEDCDHVIAVFKEKGLWGAISKTNHSVLRYRDPIYKNLRELVMSYFHEYTLNGKKTLLSYSKPLDLSKIKENWITNEDNLWFLDEKLDNLPHIPCITAKNVKLRRSDEIEIKTGDLVEYT